MHRHRRDCLGSIHPEVHHHKHHDRIMHIMSKSSQDERTTKNAHDKQI